MILLTLLLTSSACLAKSSAAPVDPKNPISLCERFIAPATRSACEKKIEKWGPDWYLASVCEKQFDDPLFFQCLELSQSKNFSPTALAACNLDGISDQERIHCLSHLKTPSAFQESKTQKAQRALRVPASRKTKKLPAKAESAPLDIGTDPN